MRTPLIAATIGLALVYATGAARAQVQEGEARCLVLGPLAVSAYVGFLEQVGAKQRSGAAERAASVAHLIDLYKRVRCAMPPLVGAIECLSAGLIDGQTREPAAALAERCMRQSGMPVR